MRYFWGSYILISDEGEVYGNFKTQSKTFPSQKTIKELVSTRRGIDDGYVSITSIFEFKSKDDFDSFEE